MKKRLLVGLLIGIMATFVLALPVAADDPNTVIVDWNGAGTVTGSVDTGDAKAQFSSGGVNQVGEFTAVDQNNNPYGYGVDTNTFTMETTIIGGGTATFQVDRLTSKESMYGPAGQQSFIGVSTVDGTASLWNRSTTNYANLIDANYGWHSNGQVTVNSTLYSLARWIDSDIGNIAQLFASGSGTANLDCMSSEARGSGETKLGAGAGCYTNADFTATGSGQLQLIGSGNTSATTAMAPGMTGASSFNFIANWLGGTFGVTDYSTVVK